MALLSFAIDDLTEKYVMPLMSSEKTTALLLRQDGRVIASSEGTLLGIDILDFLSKSKYEGMEETLGLVEEALAGEETAGVHACARFSQPGNLKYAISAFSSTQIDEESRLVVWITVPLEEVLAFTWPMKLYEIQRLIFLTGGMFFLASVFLLGLYVAKRDGFIDGFRNGQENGKK